MIFVDGKQQEHDGSTKNHATNIEITSITRHKKRFSTSNTKVKVRTTLPWSQEDDQDSMTLTWMKTLELGAALRQGVVAKRDDVLFLQMS